MRVQLISPMMKAKQLRGAALCLGIVTGLCVIAFAARFCERAIYAQVSPLPSTSTGQIGISPEEPVPPPQPIIVKVPAPNPVAKGPNAPPMEIPAVPDPDPNNPVAVQSANLLKMAYNLKSEVDRTSKDMLSVTVVRKAAEIEQMARKMRTK